MTPAVPGEQKLGEITRPSSILKKNPKYAKSGSFNANTASLLIGVQVGGYDNDTSIPGVRSNKKPPPRQPSKKLLAPINMAKEESADKRKRSKRKITFGDEKGVGIS